MKSLINGAIVVSFSLLLAACNDGAVENFTGTWKGKNDRGADFTYKIEKKDSSIQVTRQMRDYSPDLYSASAKDSTTLMLGDGDTLIYRPDSDTIYARGDDVTLNRAAK